MSPRIILASGSEQRKNLFSALNIPFEVIRSDIDEQAIQDPDLKRRAELVARLNGSSTGFTHGLPMEVLVPLLRQSGVEIKP